ncbi:hypothetical protein D3OALGA1CA_413 [Olavius algarvensis associated proteobacterium Delta 3]|nr:hypothetical protein D3OALGA1CA_413 [Olavius algarvensis associated proteobacterium Delta 3]CAB5113891.1 hypothetical protein D3OALGB2SA_2555 [Olavius algarvensis associated proteobacterium Delta 3]
MNVILANLVPDVAVSHDSGTYRQKMSNLHFPIGLGIIAAVLSRHGILFDTYDSYVDGTTRGFLELLERKPYDMVLLSGFLGNYTYRFLMQLSGDIKAVSPKTVIIIGGPIASTIPELLLRNTPVDYAVVGEGEETIVDLLGAFRRKGTAAGVPGVYARDGAGNLIYGGDRQRIRDLDAYPFPDYDAFSIDRYTAFLKESGRCLDVLASRGMLCKLPVLLPGFWEEDYPVLIRQGGCAHA